MSIRTVGRATLAGLYLTRAVLRFVARALIVGAYVGIFGLAAYLIGNLVIL